MLEDRNTMGLRSNFDIVNLAHKEKDSRDLSFHLLDILAVELREK